MIRGWFLAAAAALLGAADDGRPVTVISAGRPAAAVASEAGAMLAPDALDAGTGFRTIAMAALRAPPETAWQALAHAMDLRWMPAPGGGAWLTAGDRAMPGRPRGRTWPGAGPRPLVLEQRVRDLMAPWLAGDAGIALDPLSGAWSAALADDGLSRFEAVISALEHGAPRIPSLVVPAPPEGFHPDLPASDWQSFVADLVEAGAPAVAVHPRWLAASAPAVAAGPLATIPERLAVPSVWISGCLCIGQPSDRRHPTWSAQVAVIPIGHLRRPADAIAPLVAAAVPQRPGWGVVPHPEGTSLVLVADPVTIHGIMDLLAAWERDGALLAP